MWLILSFTVLTLYLNHAIAERRQLLSPNGVPEWLLIVNSECNCDETLEDLEEFDDFLNHKIITVRNKCFIEFEATYETVNDIVDELGDECIQSIEANEEIKISDNETITDAPHWHLDRIDQINKELDNEPFKTNFSDIDQVPVNVFIIDTGINTEHEAFDGRAVNGENFVNDISGDDNGHGTHVAALVGGNGFGVATNSTLVSVKVLDSEGLGSTFSILNGIQYAVDYDDSVHAVLVLSLGGWYSEILNEAVEEASNDPNTEVVVAAGNFAMDACYFSPASAKGSVITVGSINQNDQRSQFSNFGKCVDIWAPGTSVVSAAHDSINGTAIFSGTSMSAPIVAGVVASLSGLSTNELKAHLLENYAVDLTTFHTLTPKPLAINLVQTNMVPEDVPNRDDEDKEEVDSDFVICSAQRCTRNFNSIDFLIWEMQATVTRFRKKDNLCDTKDSDTAENTMIVAKLSTKCSVEDQIYNAADMGARGVLFYVKGWKQKKRMEKISRETYVAYTADITAIIVHRGFAKRISDGDFVSIIEIEGK